MSFLKQNERIYGNKNEELLVYLYQMYCLILILSQDHQFRHCIH